jgi:hypothetical protein
MSKERFKEFDREWSGLLDSYRVPNPLHMTNFVRPFGKNIGMYPEMKLSLFSRIVEIVNRNKLFSASVAIPQGDYAFLVPQAARKEFMGPYAFAFFCVVMLNQGMVPKFEIRTR